MNAIVKLVEFSHFIRTVLGSDPRYFHLFDIENTYSLQIFEKPFASLIENNELTLLNLLTCVIELLLGHVDYEKNLDLDTICDQMLTLTEDIRLSDHIEEVKQQSKEIITNQEDTEISERRPSSTSSCQTVESQQTSPIKSPIYTTATDAMTAPFAADILESHQAHKRKDHTENDATSAKIPKLFKDTAKRSKEKKSDKAASKQPKSAVTKSHTKLVPTTHTTQPTISEPTPAQPSTQHTAMVVDDDKKLEWGLLSFENILKTLKKHHPVAVANRPIESTSLPAAPTTPVATSNISQTPAVIETPQTTEYLPVKKNKKKRKPLAVANAVDCAANIPTKTGTKSSQPKMGTKLKETERPQSSPNNNRIKSLQDLYIEHPPITDSCEHEFVRAELRKSSVDEISTIGKRCIKCNCYFLS